MNNITIIGTGNMTQAIIGTLSSYYKVTVVGRDENKLSKLLKENPKIFTSLINNYDISDKNVILCIKPYALSDVSSVLRGKAKNIFSILASVKIDDLSIIDSHNYYRVMPNVSTKYKKSITSIYSKENAKNKEATDLFSYLGRVIWAESEKELDLVTALCSSAVAFLALTAESLSDGIVREGMSRDKSFEYISGLFESFASLLANKEKYSDIKNNVMSPSGTTAEGYYVLEQNNTRAAFMSAISASCKKAQLS